MCSGQGKRCLGEDELRTESPKAWKGDLDLCPGPLPWQLDQGIMSLITLPCKASATGDGEEEGHTRPWEGEGTAGKSRVPGTGRGRGTAKGKQ